MTELPRTENGRIDWETIDKDGVPFGPRTFGKMLLEEAVKACRQQVYYPDWDKPAGHSNETARLCVFTIERLLP